MFSRFFQSRRNKRHDQQNWTPKNNTNGCGDTSFNKNDIRLVVFQDHDITGRQLLFDSMVNGPECAGKRTGQKCSLINSKDKPPDTSAGCASTCNPKNKPMRQLSDVTMFGEMMFGSVGMSYQGSSLKIHSIRSPSQLMVTKVFMPVKNKDHSGDGEGFDNYSIQSTSSEGTMPKLITTPTTPEVPIAQSVPVDVPLSPKEKGRQQSEDSGISTSVTSYSSLGGSGHTSMPSLSSSASLGSNPLTNLARRYQRTRATSLEHGFRSWHSDDHSYESVTKRPKKFGIAIICQHQEAGRNTRQFEQFFFSHTMLIEGHVHTLQAAIDKALQTRSQTKFTIMTAEALHVFRGAIHDLYMSPRLSQPVWLDMMCYTTHRVALCDNFLREFMMLVEKFDNKNTRFFISRVLTAVLTHHLAWVPTITPAGDTQSPTYLDKHSPKWMDALAKSHPYNPLWAQLGDMYGAIGSPLHVSRTIIAGKKAELVHRLLYVLSYFIRCSEIRETTQLRPPFGNMKDSPITLSDSGSNIFSPGTSVTMSCSVMSDPAPSLGSSPRPLGVGSIRPAADAGLIDHMPKSEIEDSMCMSGDTSTLCDTDHTATDSSDKEIMQALPESKKTGRNENLAPKEPKVVVPSEEPKSGEGNDSSEPQANHPDPASQCIHRDKPGIRPLMFFRSIHDSPSMKSAFDELQPEEKCRNTSDTSDTTPTQELPCDACVTCVESVTPETSVPGDDTAPVFFLQSGEEAESEPRGTDSPPAAALKVDIPEDTPVSADASKCHVSPEPIMEDATVQRVRHVGRSSQLEKCDTSDVPSEVSQFSHWPGSKSDRSDACESDKVVMRKKKKVPTATLR